MGKIQLDEKLIKTAKMLITEVENNGFYETYNKFQCQHLFQNKEEFAYVILRISEILKEG